MGEGGGKGLVGGAIVPTYSTYITFTEYNVIIKLTHKKVTSLL